MRYKIFCLALIVSLAAMLAACGGGGDPGKSRSEQQSKELRERLGATQTDR